MIKKRAIILILCMVLIATNNVYAITNKMENSKNETLSYMITNSNSNIISAEQVFNGNLEKISWGKRTLNPGATAIFKSGSGVLLKKGKRITLNAHFNKNATMQVAIKKNNGSVLTSKSGLMGGVNLSAITSEDGYYYGYIKNNSSETVTITSVSIN